MFDDENDQYGFWTDEPTRPLERIATLRRPAGAEPTQPTRRPRPTHPQVGARSHGNTQQLPVVAADDAPDQSLRPAFTLVDPLLRRIGALAVAIALFIPVAMALRDGSSERAVSASNATSLTIAPVASASAPVADSNTESTIDIDALPPAVPVSVAGTAATEQSSPPSGEAASNSPASSGEAATAPAAQPAAAVEAVQPAAACKKYTVVAGDYWILIAKKVSVSVGDLLAANKATAKTALYPGGVICLPANASPPTTLAPTTTVKPTTTAVKATTTTVKATTTTVTVAAPPVKKTYTRAEVEAIIRYVWPDELENEAIRIATRESNLQPGVRNFCCFGLFQIYFNVHKSWLARMGITSAEQLYDPLINAQAGYALYLRAGSWGPWKL
jgi:LysM repeat protein